MAVTGLSIEPREKDRQEAMENIITALLEKLPEEEIADVLIRQQQVIIQAYRLRDATMRLVREDRAERSFESQAEVTLHG